jgi:hypothetical protein
MSLGSNNVAAAWMLFGPASSADQGAPIKECACQRRHKPARSLRRRHTSTPQPLWSGGHRHERPTIDTPHMSLVGQRAVLTKQ